MKCELVDNHGTKIEGTFFNASADNFERRIQEGKVYLWSNGQVKIANRKFTKVKNDYQIVFEKNA